MKNLITITALIAAGAIAANAETNLKPGDNFGGLDWTQLTLTSPSGNALSSSNSGFNWSESQGDLTESWSLLFTLKTSSTSGKKDVFSTNAANGGAGGLVLGLDFSDLTSTKIGLYNGKVSSGSSPLSGSVINFTTGQNVMLTFLKYDDATSTSKSKAGKFVLSTYNDKTLSQKAEFEVDKDQSNLTFLKNSSSGTGTRLWTNGGAEQFSNIALAYGSTTSAIPEPSSFGLLAGLGALALVGARRRRR